MLSIIEDATTIEPNLLKGNIVVESDKSGPPFNAAFDELNETTAIVFAQNYAAQCGISPAYVNGSKIGPYPVNSEGVPLEQVTGPDKKPLKPTHPLMQPHRYRIEVPVARPLR
jgi:hypothetical protein